MRKSKFILSIFLFILLPLSSLWAAPNLLTNGDFSNGTSSWSLYNASGSSSTLSVVNGEAFVAITSGGTATHKIQLKQTGVSLENGKTYQVNFDAKSVVARDIQVDWIKNTSPVSGSIPASGRSGGSKKYQCLFWCYWGFFCR